MPTIQIPYPLTPRHVNWDSQFADIPGNTDKYPACFEEIREEPDTRVNILDVGCGHGGLLYALSPVFPQHHILGLEIRERTVNHTVEQILVSRWETPGAYNNISIVRANVTKHIANFVEAGSIEKMFFSFPDPKFT